MSSKVAKSALILMIATLLSKVLGFSRDLVLASTYGAGVISDAYLMALSIPTILFLGSFCVAIQNTYMPLFTEIDKQKGREDSLKFTSNVMNLIIILSIFVIILGLIFTEPLVKLFAMGFEGERLSLTVQFTKIILFSIGIVCITYVVKAYLEIHDNFLVTGLMPLPYNIAIIASIILSKNLGLNTLAYGTVIAFLIQFLVLIPSARKKGFKYQFKVDVKDVNVKKMALLIVPVLVGASITQVNNLIDKNLASTLAEGSISAINYAYKLNIFVTGMFVASITSVIYPLFSRLISENNMEKLKETLSTSINAVMLIIVPVSIGAFVLAKPIVELLFERGEFTSQDTIVTANVLACYAIGMLASGVRDILVRVYYSLQDTKTPMKNSIICVVFNVVFNLMLIKYLGAPGLALATSISAILSVLFLTFNLRKKIGRINGKIMIQTLLKTGVSGIIMGIIVTFVHSLLLPISSIIAMVLSVLVGAIIYAIMVLLLKVDSCDYVISVVKSKIGNRIKR